MADFTALVEAVTKGRRAPPGVSVVVVQGDAVVAQGAAGMADLSGAAPMSVDRACNWFSMTKIATATAAMMLSEQGSLDLGGEVGSYLGELWPRALDGVRVHHLLNHSGGVRNPVPIRWVHRAGDPRPDPSAFLGRALRRQHKPRSNPGSRASYSNIGFLALGQVIAAAAGCPYETFVTQNVLQPLGMTDTAFTWRECPSPRAIGHQRLPRLLTPALRAMLPSGLCANRNGPFVALRPFELDGAAYGGLIGPVTDAARLVALFANRGSVNGARLLSAETCARMTTIRTPGRHYDLGLGWFRPHRSSRVVEHLGGGIGFWNLLSLDPVEGRGVAVMSNATGHWDIEGFAEQVLLAAATEPRDAAR